MPCAYCDRDVAATKEHIWPASIIRHVNERIRYSERAKKTFWADMVIKDVCAQCNNGPLSALDAYGAIMYDKYFSNFHTSMDPLDFIYDFDRLSRWLLKLSYNSARGTGRDAVRLANYKNVLIDPNIELPDDFSIAVDLVLPGAFPGAAEATLPASNRLARVKFTGGFDDWCTVRLVAINSYYFYVLIQDVPDGDVNMEHVREVIEAIPGRALKRDASEVRLVPSGTTTWDVHEDWAHTLKGVGLPPSR